MYPTSKESGSPQIPEQAQPEQAQPQITKEEETMWDQATKSVYISFANEPNIEVRFSGSSFRTVAGLQGKQAYEFSVVDRSGKSRILSTQSVRLMGALKKHLPLQGKWLHIIRAGDGMGTTYVVNVC